MNKKILCIFLFFITFFIGITNVRAITCAEIDEKIELYNHHQTELENVDCSNNNDEKVVATCNDSNMAKNAIVIELMRLNDNGSICEAKQAEVDAIIEENKDKCAKVLDETFTDSVNRVLVLFYIIGPILLVVFGTVDYAKAVVSSDQELLRNANKRFFKRLTATILLVLTPVLVNLILSFNTSDYQLSGNSYSCEYTYSAYFKNWNIVYKPKQKKTTSKSSSSGNAAIGGENIDGYTIFKQGDPAWGEKRLLASSSHTIHTAGCALTSVAMAIVNSGVETTEAINPGTLNDILLKNGAYSGGCIVWSGSKFATNSKFTCSDSSATISGNISNKASQLASYISQGYYPVIQVKYGTDSFTHYVTVFKVENGNIYAGDPATGTLSILNNTSYPIATDSYSAQAVLYQKE